jgi:hypothetical protein
LAPSPIRNILPTWACVLCVVQAITRVPLSRYLGPRLVNVHLALDPSSVLYLQHKLCSYLDALQHLPPPQPVPASSCHSGTSSSLSHGFLHAAPLGVPLLPLRPPQPAASNVNSSVSSSLSPLARQSAACHPPPLERRGRGAGGSALGPWLWCAALWWH